MLELKNVMHNLGPRQLWGNRHFLFTLKADLRY